MRVSKTLPKVQLQVDLLESAGFDVNLKHVSYGDNRGVMCNGFSKVTITDVTGYNVGLGTSTCSKLDNFNRATGTQVAFRRAISDFYDTVGYRKAGTVLYPQGDES